MEKFLRLVASEPDICSRTDHGRQFEVGRAGDGSEGISKASRSSTASALKKAKPSFFEQAKLVHRYGAAVVVMAFDETAARPTRLSARSRSASGPISLLTEHVGFPPQDIIFDPNILTVATGMEEHNNYAVNFFEATRWIKQHLPLAKVSGGVSNISFSFRGNNVVREAMHAAFLYHADQGRSGHGHCECRPAGGVRGDSQGSCWSWSKMCC